MVDNFKVKLAIDFLILTKTKIEDLLYQKHKACSLALCLRCLALLLALLRGKTSTVIFDLILF